mgnify:FL=1
MAEDTQPEFTPEEEEILGRIVEQKEANAAKAAEFAQKSGEQTSDDGVQTEQPKDLTLTPERVRALKRAKVPEAVLDKFADSPESLSEWADTLMEMQGNVDG